MTFLGAGGFYLSSALFGWLPSGFAVWNRKVMQLVGKLGDRADGADKDGEVRVCSGWHLHRVSFSLPLQRSRSVASDSCLRYLRWI